jgi:hypothetical protein
MPIEAELADGRVLEFPDGTDPAVIQRTVKSMIGQQAPQGGPMQKVASWANQAIAGVGDSVLNTPANLMNLGKAGFGVAATELGRGDLAPEITPPPNYLAKAGEKLGLINPDLDPTTTGGRIAKAAVQGATLGPLAPAQSVKQAMLNSALSGASTTAGQTTTEITGSPEAGAAVTMAAVPALSAASNAMRASSMKAKSQNAVKDQTLKAAQDEGYVVPPSAKGGNWFTRRLESIAGKDATSQEATVRNQEITNKIARREIGLPEDQAISMDALKQRRNVLAAPYRELRKISPKVSSTLDELQETRQDATAYWQEFARQGTVSARKEALKLDAKADTLETQLEAAAKSAMKPDLVKRLREARVAIAKTHDVERALNVGSGDVSAAVLGRAVDKGKPLTGGLATAGKFQQAFPRYAREGEKMPAAGVSKSEAIMATLLGAGGFGVAGPAGLGLAALPLASGPTRSLLLSGAMQGGPLYPAANLPLVSDPMLRGILASQGMTRE